MFSKFLVLQWKAAVRSPIWQKNLILNLIIGFFLFLFAVYLLLLGFILGKLLEELVPGADKIKLINGVLIYYLLADLFIRFMMQSLPRITIESFLHLPVRKHRLINFIIGRTVFDVFNIIPLLILVPVTFTIITPEAGAAYAIRWILMIVMTVLANNFLATYFKRLLGSRPLLLLWIGLTLIALIILENVVMISFSRISADFFGFLPAYSLNLFIPAAWLFFTYLLHYNFLKKHLYPDEIQLKRTVHFGQEVSGNYFRSFGLMGSIVLLEMKLYWRNKRTRTIIYMLPLFLLYGLMFYRDKNYLEQDMFLMFVGVFMTGGMMINYANYAFGYESSYFDALMTKNIDFIRYIRVKYYISVMICSVCFILTIPYLFYGFKILLINFAMFLYNIGLLSFVMLYFATFNRNRMDLTRGGVFNYQGIGAMNWLAVLPAFVLPILIYIPLNMAGHPYFGIGITAFLGIMGLVTSGFFIKIIGKNFYRRKYVMAASFREK